MKVTHMLIRLIKNSQVPATTNPDDDTSVTPLHVAQNHFTNLAMSNILSGYQKVKEGQLLGNPQYEIPLQEQHRITRSIDFILKLIEEFEGGARGKKDQLNPAEQLTIVVDSSMPGALPPKRFNVSATKHMSIGELRKLIASKMNPPVPPEDVMMFSKGAILDKDRASIAERKITNNQTIICSKNQPLDDYYDVGVQGPTIGPQKEVSEVELNSKIEMLLGIFADQFDISLLKFALQRKNYNTEDTINALLEPSNVELYYEEMEIAEREEKKKKTANNAIEGPSKPAASKSLSGNIADHTEYFELFFELLQIPNNELQAKVWSLLSNLPLNTRLYDRIKGVFEEADGLEVEWEEMIGSENPSRLLYSLQIMNTFITCATLDEKEQAAEVYLVFYLLYIE